MLLCISRFSPFSVSFFQHKGKGSLFPSIQSFLSLYPTARPFQSVHCCSVELEREVVKEGEGGHERPLSCVAVVDVP